MNRDELTALRDVLDLILRLPDDLRAQVAAWLSPPAAKPGNGLDPHPPPVADARQGAQTGEIPHSPAKRAKAARPASPRALRPGGQPSPAKAAERKLLEALRANPGSERRPSSPSLAGQSRERRPANACASSARRGTVEKDVIWAVAAARRRRRESQAPRRAAPLRRRPCRPDGGANTWEGAVKFIRNKGEALIALSVGMVHFRSRR